MSQTEPTSTIAIRKPLAGHARGIHQLVTYWSERTPVLQRSLGEIYENLREFVIALDGDRVVGCAALHIDWGDLAEVRTVCVADEMRGRGIGEKLVRALIEEAAGLGIEKVFCLTDQPGWFARLGFGPIDKGELPHKVWRDCVHCPIFTQCTEVAMARAAAG